MADLTAGAARAPAHRGPRHPAAAAHLRPRQAGRAGQRRAAGPPDPPLAGDGTASATSSSTCITARRRSPRVVGDGRDLGVRVRYSWEQPVLGSAGGPRHALPLLTDARRRPVPDRQRRHADRRRHRRRCSPRTARRARSSRWRSSPTRGPTSTAASAVATTATSPASPRPRHAPASRSTSSACRSPRRAAFASLDGRRAGGVGQRALPALIAGDAAERRRRSSRDASFSDIGTPRDYLDDLARARGRRRRPAGAGPRVARGRSGGDRRARRCGMM